MTQFLWQALGLYAPESGEGAETPEVESTTVGAVETPEGDPASGEPTAEASSPEEHAKQTVSLDTFRKRVSALTTQRDALKAQAESAAQELARIRQSATQANGETESSAKPSPQGSRVFTEAEALAFADQRAAMMAFNEKCNAVAAQGKAQYSDFDNAVQAINSGVGEMTPQFLEAVLETGAPSDVIYALGKQLDRAADIMALSPARQGVALAKFAAELASNKKPAGKKVSDAPEPISPKVGAPKMKGSPSIDDDSIDIKEWMRLRETQLKERRR
jgi:hypothetical protein